MSKETISFAILTKELKEAGADFDFKALAAKAIKALGASEDAVNAAAESVAELGKALEQSAVSVTTLNEQIAQLQAAADSTDLNERIEALETELEASNQEKDAALEAVAELGKRMDIYQNNADGSVIVEVRGLTKKLIGNRFSLKGEQAMDAKTLSQRPDLLERMLDTKSGSLVDPE
jgi:TolA-binding protein